MNVQFLSLKFHFYQGFDFTNSEHEKKGQLKSSIKILNFYCTLLKLKYFHIVNINHETNFSFLFRLILRYTLHSDNLSDLINYRVYNNINN